jgi:hypothetical protein
MANRLVNRTNAVFARLSVIENSGADHRGKRLWRCLCLCGNERVTTADKLREGRVKSCGCTRRDRTPNTSTATVPALVIL